MRWTLGAVLTMIPVLAPPAHGGSPPPATVVAPELPSTGVRSAEQKGRAVAAAHDAQQAYGQSRLTQALAHATRAYDDLPNASFALLRATILVELRRYDDAFAAFLVAADMAPTASEAKMIQAGLQEAGRRTRQPLGWVQVRTKPEGARVVVNRRTVKAPRTVGLSAGWHDIAVTAPHHHPLQLRIQVEAGQGQQVKWGLRESVPLDAPVTSIRPKRVEADALPAPTSAGGGVYVAQRRDTALPTALLVTGGVLIAGGVAAHVWALDARSEANRLASPVAGMTTPERARRHEEAQQDANLRLGGAIAAYALGAGALVAGIYLFVQPDEDPATLAPAALRTYDGGAAPGFVITGSL